MRDLRRYKWTLQYLAVVMTLVFFLQIADTFEWRL